MKLGVIKHAIFTETSLLALPHQFCKVLSHCPRSPSPPLCVTFKLFVGRPAPDFSPEPFQSFLAAAAVQSSQAFQEGAM